jgi:hypothetical protein
VEGSVSEFYPTTYASFYETFVPFDDYDEPDPDADYDTPVLTRVPIQILLSSASQYQPVDNRGTTVKLYNGRVRGHYDIKLTYKVKDERTGVFYSIDDIDLDMNPLGDDSWVLTLRKVPSTAGK